MRYAFRISYYGAPFRGFARQPDGRTVEGELRKALERIGGPGLADGLSFSSRTDSGVNAYSNVICVTSEIAGEELQMALNSNMEHVWVYAHAVVPDDFDPRNAASRTYVYIIQDAARYEVPTMKDAAALFEGTHDFSAFSKKDPTRNVNTERKVISSRLFDEGGALLYEVKANSFLWEMVRRMAGAIEAVGSGKASESELQAMLRPERFDGGAEAARKLAGTRFGVAPPENLTLLDVSYDPPLEWKTSGKVIENINDLLVKRFVEAERAMRFRNGFVGFMNAVLDD